MPPDATWTEGDATYTVTGLRATGDAIRARAGALTAQVGQRAAGADAALAELRGPVAVVLRDQAVRTIDALVDLVAGLRRAAAICDTFPEAAGAPGPPAPAPVAAARAEGDAGGSPDDLRAYATASGDWDEAVARAVAAVTLDGVTATRSVLIERPAPPPATPPPPGTPPAPPMVVPGPPEPVDPRTLVTLPDLSGEAATVTASSAGGARVATAAARAFATADGGLLGWIQQARLALVLAEVRSSHGLRPADLRRELRELWVGVAAERAGIDLDAWDPSGGAGANEDTIEAVYEYYGQLFLDHPELEWAGMANMIGPSFAAGFFDLDAMGDLAGNVSAWVDGLPAPVRGALPPDVRALAGLGDLTEAELRFYETTFLEMQREIFIDQAVMHEAYLAGGMEAVTELRDAGIIDERALGAWQSIHDGAASGDADLVSAGNAELLWREQNQIIDDSYDRMYDRFPSGPAVTYAMTLVGAPSVPGASAYAQHDPLRLGVETPGPERLGTPDRIGTPERIGVGPFGVDVPSVGVDIPSVSVDNPLQGRVTVQTPLPAGNIADAGDRWDLIIGDTLPAYQDLLRDDPARVRDIVGSPVDERIAEHRLLEQVDEIAARLLEWELGFEQ